MKVAYQGTLGSYGHQASIKYFDDKVEPEGFTLSEQVVDALVSREVDYAILPVENSIIGNIDINMDLIYKNELKAIAECYVPIKHCLLGKPGTKLEDIKVVYSHPAALGQCRDFLVEQNIKSSSYFDTAGACRKVENNKDGSVAAIASSFSESFYDVSVIKEGIQKVEKNVTRFLILSVLEDFKRLEKGEEGKAMIAFNTKNKPGALLEVLKVFELFNINLTRLESMPIPENLFQYTFFLEFESDRGSDQINQCFQVLKSVGVNFKITGIISSVPV